MARPQCKHCMRPQALCLCPWLPLRPQRHSTRVVVLQHPSEAKHPLNTARFLPFGLAQCQLHVGETFAELNTWLADPHYRSAVLFPHAQAGLPAPPSAPNSLPWQLFVPDGTWRKAKRLMHLNPALQALPHITLPLAQSAYVLRHTTQTNAYATLEAVATALMGFEPWLDLGYLHAPLHRLMQDQRHAMGETIFQQHYAARQQH